jgi:replicative superfamily II helicase
MLAGFLRALINLGSRESDEGHADKNYLRRLRELDLLFLAVSAFESRNQLLLKPSKQDRLDVDDYIENLPTEEKPLVNLWRDPDSMEYPTRRLLSSLRFTEIKSNADEKMAFYRLLETAILLHRHAKGVDLQALASSYKVQAGALENGLKFTVTWVLSCLAQICSADKCYKLDFLAMKIYELLEDLSLGSTLGKLMTVKGIGRTTVRKLLDGGYPDANALSGVTEPALLQLGIAHKQAASILRFIRRQAR